MQEAQFAYTSKVFDNLYTVRGDTPEQFVANLEAAAAAIPAIAKLQAAALSAKITAAAATNVRLVEDPFATATPAPTSVVAEPAHICSHGIRVWREGTSKAGKPYAGWYCTSRDQSNQCPPEYPPRGR
jgi:hypothetical protein